MSKQGFDSSQVHPLFKIISPPKTKGTDSVAAVTLMLNKTDMNQRQRRKTKRPDVPVHKSQNLGSLANNDNIPIHKTFSANFHSHKHKQHKHEKELNPTEDVTTDTILAEGNESIAKVRIKRKHLIKENDRMAAENHMLTEQLLSVQNVLAKKDSQISKLKEKVILLQTHNGELATENSIIKTQYEDILVNLEEFKTQMKIKCKSCEDLKEILKRQTKDLEISKSNNKDLTEDLNMLKNVIYRLNVQLERYQQKIQNPNAVTSCSNNLNMVPEIESDVLDAQTNNIISQNIEREALQHNDHLHTPVSWGNVNTHTLGPLLDAYQDTIKEKEDIIIRYELEFVTFTKKLKSVIEENEMLHKKSIHESEILQKNTCELETNRKELKILKEQNDLLIKKCAMKHDKLQEICKVYDHKIDSMRRDYEVLQDQYHRTRVELSSIQGKYQSLADIHDSLKSDKENVIALSVHTASVNECKRLFEELKNQYDIEKAKFLNQIKLLEQQITELETKVVEIGTEKRELLIKIKTAEKHVKKLEHQLAENQSLLTHTQISRDACKRQLGKAIEFGRELVNEQESLLQQLSSRHKENKAVKQIGSSIVSRMDILKSQLKTVQKDAFQQLASVEQRIQQQDSSMESMRRDHENEVEKLLQEIHNKDQYIVRLIDQNRDIPPAPYLLYREKHMHLSET